MARREFADALRELEHAAAAEKLKRRVDEAACLIALRPAIGRCEPKLANTRFRFSSVAGFPYFMMYRPDTVPPSIVRFVHTARDLGPLLAELAGSPSNPDLNYYSQSSISRRRHN